MEFRVFSFSFHNHWVKMMNYQKKKTYKVVLHQKDVLLDITWFLCPLKMIFISIMCLDSANGLVSPSTLTLSAFKWTPVIHEEKMMLSDTLFLPTHCNESSAMWACKENGRLYDAGWFVRYSVGAINKNDLSLNVILIQLQMVI